MIICSSSLKRKYCRHIVGTLWGTARQHTDIGLIYHSLLGICQKTLELAVICIPTMNDMKTTPVMHIWTWKSSLGSGLGWCLSSPSLSWISFKNGLRDKLLQFSHILSSWMVISFLNSFHSSDVTWSKPGSRYNLGVGITIFFHTFCTTEFVFLQALVNSLQIETKVLIQIWLPISLATCIYGPNLSTAI